jgi:hypothetical protein
MHTYICIYIYVYIHRGDGEVEGGRITKETFIRYYEIMSFYTDSEVNFERNLASIFVITPEDMLDYIVKKRATVDKDKTEEEEEGIGPIDSSSEGER